MAHFFTLSVASRSTHGRRRGCGVFVRGICFGEKYVYDIGSEPCYEPESGTKIMSIDIKDLSYEELLELKHLITRRLQHLDSLNSGIKKELFQLGDQINFSHPINGRMTGILLKHNEKTVTIVTDSGQHWDVSPHLLKKVVQGGIRKKKGKIVTIKKD